MIDRCRVCSGNLAFPPSITYKNMPLAAQYLPDKSNLHSDRSIDLKISQCKSCGLVQTLNEPVTYFREVIRAAGISKDMTAFRKKQFQNFISQYELRKKKLVEIGCGRGEFLQIAQEFCTESYGIESGAIAAGEAKKAGMNVTQMFLDSGNELIPNGPFDAFLFLNFLEHLPEPTRVLKGIRRNIAEGGVGLVEVPNFDMMLDKKLFTEFTTDHLFYFTRETLLSTLRMNGFEVLSCEESWHRYTISAVVQKRKPVDLENFEQLANTLRYNLHQFIDQYPTGEVAVWGAGHEALTVMAIAELGEKINYVVDSAPFKQGCFTPTTHIPIVSPETFFGFPCQAIVVIAGSYSSEVVKIINENLLGRIDIAILDGCHVKKIDSN